MFSNPIVDEVLAHIKQDEAIQEVKPRTPINPKRAKRVRKVFLMGV